MFPARESGIQENPEHCESSNKQLSKAYVTLKDPEFVEIKHQKQKQTYTYQ